jgi:hypothetical protein
MFKQFLDEVGKFFNRLSWVFINNYKRLRSYVFMLAMQRKASYVRSNQEV